MTKWCSFRGITVKRSENSERVWEELVVLVSGHFDKHTWLCKGSSIYGYQQKKIGIHKISNILKVG